MILPLSDREVWERALTRAFNRWHVLITTAGPLIRACSYAYQAEIERRWQDVEQILAAMKENGAL